MSLFNLSDKYKNRLKDLVDVDELEAAFANLDLTGGGIEDYVNVKTLGATGIGDDSQYFTDEALIVPEGTYLLDRTTMLSLTNKSIIGTGGVKYKDWNSGGITPNNGIVPVTKIEDDIYCSMNMPSESLSDYMIGVSRDNGQIMYPLESDKKYIDGIGALYVTATKTLPESITICIANLKTFGYFESKKGWEQIIKDKEINHPTVKFFKLPWDGTSKTPANVVYKENHMEITTNATEFEGYCIHFWDDFASIDPNDLKYVACGYDIWVADETYNGLITAAIGVDAKVTSTGATKQLFSSRGLEVTTQRKTHWGHNVPNTIYDSIMKPALIKQLYYSSQAVPTEKRLAIPSFQTGSNKYVKIGSFAPGSSSNRMEVLRFDVILFGGTSRFHGKYIVSMFGSNTEVSNVYISNIGRSGVDYNDILSVYYNNSTFDIYLKCSNAYLQAYLTYEVIGYTGADLFVVNEEIVNNSYNGYQVDETVWSNTTPTGTAYGYTAQDTVRNYTGIITLADINSGKILISGQYGKKILPIRYFAKVTGGFTGGTGIVLQDDNSTPVIVTTLGTVSLTDGAKITSENTIANVTDGAGMRASLTTGKNLVVAPDASLAGGTSITISIDYIYM